MMPRGRPFKPGNKSGRGRPKGSCNKQSALQALLEIHGPAIFNKGLELVNAGSERMICYLLDYVLTKPRELLIDIGPLPMGTAEELSESSKKLMKITTEGEISLGQASAVSGLMDKRRQIIHLEEHERLLQDLENQAKAAREAKQE
jgi:hypothetical protein